MDKVDMIFTTCSLIYKLYEMIETTKANKERCQRVAERVRALEELVWTVKQRGPDQISDSVVKALNELWFILLSAKELMMKFTKSKSLKKFATSKSNEEKFCKVNQRLTENLQVLSTALQVEQGNLLQKVYESVTDMKQNEKQPVGPGALPPPPMPTPLSPPPIPTLLSPPPMPTPLSPPPIPTLLSPPPMPTPLSPPPMPIGLIPPPTPPIHLPMSACHPVTPIPVQSFISPRPVSIPSAIMPGTCFVTPAQVSNPMNPMNPMPIAQIPFSPTVVPCCVPVPAPMAPMPLIKPVAIMRVPPQNTSIVSSVVNSFFR